MTREAACVAIPGRVPILGEEGPDRFVFMYVFSNPRSFQRCGIPDLVPQEKFEKKEKKTPGIQFINNLKMIQAPAELMDELFTAGYVLVNCHWKKMVDDRYILYFTFTKGGQPLNDREMTAAREAFRRINEPVYDFCHGWRNPDGSTVIYFKGPLGKGTRPRHILSLI